MAADVLNLLTVKKPEDWPGGRGKSSDGHQDGSGEAVGYPVGRRTAARGTSYHKAASLCPLHLAASEAGRKDGNTCPEIDGIPMDCKMERSLINPDSTKNACDLWPQAQVKEE